MRIKRLAVPLLLLTLVALPAVVAAAVASSPDGADGDGIRHRVVRIEKKAGCDGEGCADAVERHRRAVVFVGADGEVTRLGDEDFAFDWVEGEGPHRFVFRGGGNATFLGVGLTELTPELRTHFGAADDAGVLVSKVVEESPAWRAGLRVGDVVTSLDGQPVASGGALARAVGEHEAGDAVTVEVLRDGRRESFIATLEEHEGEARRHRVAARAGKGARFEACGDVADCKLEIRCDGGDCDCTVNGESADCEGLHAFHLDD